MHSEQDNTIWKGRDVEITSKANESCGTPSIINQSTVFSVMQKSSYGLNTFSEQKNLVQYHLTDASRKPFACTRCGEAFGLAKDLADHWLTHTDEQLFECASCGVRFKQASGLNAHLLTHTSFACTHCDKVYDELANLNEHFRRVHFKENFKTSSDVGCSDVNSDYPSEKQLSGLNQLNAEPSSAVNRVGSIGFRKELVDDADCMQKLSNNYQSTITAGKHSGQDHTSLSSEDVEIEVEPDDESIDASVFDPVATVFKVSTMFSLMQQVNELETGYESENHENHFTADNSKARFACTHCSKRFGTGVQFLTHFRSTHPGVKLFACTHCSKRFRSAHYLEKHSTIHTGEKPFANQQFCERITTASYLEQHVGIHRFSCTKCSMRFTTSNKLATHVRKTHPGEKPFACTHCSKRFRTAGFFERHVAMHTVEPDNVEANLIAQPHTDGKQFDCTHCDKTFLYSWVLQKHLLKHTSEKSYACKACDKTFLKSMQLKEHNCDHQQESLLCFQCSKTFMHADQLDVHLRKHDGEEFGKLQRHSIRRESSSWADDCCLDESSCYQRSVDNVLNCNPSPVGCKAVLQYATELPQSLLNDEQHTICVSPVQTESEFFKMNFQENEDLEIGEDWKLLVDSFVELFPLKHPTTSSMLLYG